MKSDEIPEIVEEDAETSDVSETPQTSLTPDTKRRRKREFEVDSHMQLILKKVGDRVDNWDNKHSRYESFGKYMANRKELLLPQVAKVIRGGILHKNKPAYK